MSLDGQGPPSLPAFVFDFAGSYEFSVECHLRAEVVSTSDWHDDIPIDRKVEFFGRPPGLPAFVFDFQHRRSYRGAECGLRPVLDEFEFGKMLSLN